jgi:hypothetical protein
MKRFHFRAESKSRLPEREVKFDFENLIESELRAQVLNRANDEQHSNRHHRMKQRNYPSSPFGMTILMQLLTGAQFASTPATR